MNMTYKMARDLLLSILVLAVFSASYLLAKKYTFSWNLAPSQSLSETTCSLLTNISEPIHITLFSNDVELHHQAQLLITKYQANHQNVQLTWQTSPYRHSPDYQGPALLVKLGDKMTIVDLLHHSVNEQTLTQALFKLHNQLNQWVVFLQGHNEPDAYGTRPIDYGLLRIALQNQGLKVQSLTLTKTPLIADNTRLLVIASPKVALLPMEETLIASYLNKGGSLLWLIDKDMHPQPFLSSLFHVASLPGTIVDLHGHHLGTPHPAITIVDAYPALPFTTPKSLTAFPFSVALEQQKNNTWNTQPLLLTHEKSWTETGNLTGALQFDPEKQEVMGPLTLGLYLTQKHPAAQEMTQRIAIIGNSRFLSNGVIENYGNLALGLNIFHWLGHDDALVTLAQPTNIDEIVQIHLYTALLLQYGFPFLLCLFIGIIVVYYRQRLLAAIQ